MAFKRFADRIFNRKPDPIDTGEIRANFAKENKMALKVGHFAPDFSLETHLGEKVRLSDYRGKKNVALVFFPLAFTPI